jgi:RNA polymerase sigma factor (sigma-70 family)
LRIPKTGEADANDQIVAPARVKSDIGLLKLMSQRIKDEASADAAFLDFYSRHSKYMWTVCANIAEALNGDAWIQDVFQETFERAYEKADTFKLPTGVSPESEVRLVRGWLGKIAANLLKRLLLNHHNEYTRDNDNWQKIANTLDEGEVAPTISPKRRLVDEALEALSERDQLVIRITFQYYRIGENFRDCRRRLHKTWQQNSVRLPRI